VTLVAILCDIRNHEMFRGNSSPRLMCVRTSRAQYLEMKEQNFDSIKWRLGPIGIKADNCRCNPVPVLDSFLCINLQKV
jgi:hypothetical protein